MCANGDGTGTYDPVPKPAIDGEGRPWKDIKLDSARAKYWLGVGAQPSDTAWRLLSMVCRTYPKSQFPNGPHSCRNGGNILEMFCVGCGSRRICFL